METGHLTPVRAVVRLIAAPVAAVELGEGGAGRVEPLRLGDEAGEREPLPRKGPVPGQGGIRRPDAPPPPEPPPPAMNALIGSASRASGSRSTSARRR